MRTAGKKSLGYIDARDLIRAAIEAAFEGIAIQILSGIEDDGD